METKEIIIPDDWKIEKVEGNKVILRESKKELPNTWDECCEQLKRGEYINESSEIIEFDTKYITADNYNTLPTGLSGPLLALCRLLVCREVYRQGWKPNWTDSNIKYCIIYANNKVDRSNNYTVASLLSFQSAEVCEQFFENFRYLIEEAKKLI